MDRFVASSSGVNIANNFRDNLIIDRHDPVFAGMRASKVKHLRSENSEDAVTWNVFRTLRQIDPAIWLPPLGALGLPGHALGATDSVVVDLWRSAEPPPGLLLSGGEGKSEIDIVIESPQWVWFIEAKYHSDISMGTTTRPDRNQVIRNLDVGSYYAGVRQFYFTLLVRARERTPQGCAAVERYCGLSAARDELKSHRPDGLINLQAVTLLTWSQVGAVLKQAAASSMRDDERGYSQRLIEWLAGKDLIDI